jgi:hypothetical protein
MPIFADIIWIVQCEADKVRVLGKSTINLAAHKREKRFSSVLPDECWGSVLTKDQPLPSSFTSMISSFKTLNNNVRTSYNVVKDPQSIEGWEPPHYTVKNSKADAARHNRNTLLFFRVLTPTLYGVKTQNIAILTAMSTSDLTSQEQFRLLLLMAHNGKIITRRLL